MRTIQKAVLTPKSHKWRNSCSLWEKLEKQHLLNSFLDSFGFFIVNIHQSAIDCPAPQICIILPIFYVAVYSKGGAYKNQIHKY